jgi:hypothetical protein
MSLDAPTQNMATKPAQQEPRMKKYIVTTTINAPTEAIKRFDAMAEWTLIVVGDQKTPPYHLERGTYLNPQQQAQLYPALSDAIGWNCIQRRNIGIVHAYAKGADVIALVDDDNIPQPHWGSNICLQHATQTRVYHTKAAAFDPVGATNAFPVWHRGFPVQLLAQRDYSDYRMQDVYADVQADFWHGDPDTDAIARMIYQPNCQFEDHYFPMASTQMAPFNSQNTFLSRAWVKHYFLCPGIGRMDDIWAAYYLQALGAKVLFQKASVIHQRNEHDLSHDFELEYLGHQKTLALIQALQDKPDHYFSFLPPQAKKALACYQQQIQRIDESQTCRT